MIKLWPHLTTITLIASLLIMQGTYAGSEKRGHDRSPEAEKSVDLKKGANPTVSELLRTKLKHGDTIIWHLYQSGFAVKTARHLFIFDYWPATDAPKGGGGLRRGFVNPEEIGKQDAVVFVSHCHLDHWYPGCLPWKEKVTKIHYVVSPDVSRTRQGVITSLGPNETANIGDVHVTTLRSTDVGVAFIVKTDGLTIYHSGDNACWNWDNHPQAKARFVTEHLNPLKGEKIDIAMHVCDPRLRTRDWGGFVAFPREFKPGLLIPMHMEGRYEFTRMMESLLKEGGVQVPFWPIQRRGESIVFRAGKMEKPSIRTKREESQGPQRFSILRATGDPGCRACLA